MILALCALMLAALLAWPPAGADDGLSFLAINDYMPPELINAVVYYGGAIYVPSWIFTYYNLGIYYSYFSTNSTAYVYNKNHQLFFELSTGKTYSGDDTEYSAPAIMWGGAVYLPLEFLRSYFGCISYRMIGSNAYGSILRISNGTEVLSDEEFFRAAEASMRRYYQKMKTEATPAPTTAPVPTPTPTPPPAPTPTEKPSRAGDTIRLGLSGLPTAAALELLRKAGTQATIFLSAEEIRSAPDMVRRLACEGYPLGVRSEAGSAEECVSAASLLWETARVNTILAAMPEDAEAPEGMVVFPAARPDAETERTAQDAAYAVTNRLENSKGDQMLIFPADGESDDALRIVLYYINDMEFTVAVIRETDGGRKPITP